jgi:LmbE family N-acetylglucosaminyl deacetylase
MKQVLLGVFAHPDDEAFGPSGTLLKLKSEGYDIHLALLTDGEAGTNPDQASDLGQVRLKEWQTAGELLGATSQTALHFPDGQLETVPPDEIDRKLTDCLLEILGHDSQPAAVSVMTLEPHGLTGHRDHIAASLAARRLFESLPAANRGKLWYFCLSEAQAPLSGTAYYQPRAREARYITDRVDVSAVLDRKYRLIDAHASQRTDGANLKALGDELLSTECFHIESGPIDRES